jgi:apolipoprotein N-acyltransferase
LFLAPPPPPPPLSLACIAWQSFLYILPELWILLRTRGSQSETVGGIGWFWVAPIEISHTKWVYHTKCVSDGIYSG